PSGDSQNYSAYPVLHVDFPFPDHYLQQETDGDLVPPTVPQPNTCHHQEGNGAWRSDTSCLIKEIVTCGPVTTNAVVDTGAAISVMSPTLLHRTGYLLQEWHGPAIVLANGTRAVPLGGAQISITYRNKTVSGTAVVLPMNEIEFLMGNDFLRQFGHLHVDYTGEQAHVIFGNQPSFALNCPEPPVQHTKLWSLEGCIIPAFSVVLILTTGDTQFPGVSPFTSSEKLLSTKSLSVGHAVLFNAKRSLPVANISAVPDWLNKHSTQGTLQPYTDDVVVSDHPDSFDGANQVVSNGTLPLEKNMSETSLETSINPDLPPRIRRKPNLFMAGLIYLLLLKICNALPSKDGIIIRDTVIFKEQPSISFSESSWTVVTDVLLHDAETAIAAVEDHLAKLSRVAHAHHMDGTKFEKDDVRTAWRDTTSFMAANKIDNQVRLMGRTLNDSKTRLATCALTLSGARRPKRGILDLGGSTLKWLFGVSTQADLQDLNSRIEALTNSDKTVIHLLDQHASIINETLQITRSNLALLTELQHQSEILTQRVDYIMDYIKSYELIHVQQTQYFAELDATFATMEHILGWLQQQIESWEIGLSALANGRLSPQMFSPTMLQTVIADININLPLGWAIPSEDLWV
ncbi:Uncharacterized protein APZ42_009673, partial [Daphnia magna]